MDIQEELERTRIMNLATQHSLILRKLDKLCQELCDMDTKEFIKVHDDLVKDFIENTMRNASVIEGED
tara:strand:- start:862 stop:1065 length:204 start_codon:yes stop_codon:yes gene_type:complete